MVLSAQPERVRVGQTLHLALTVHVAQRVARLDNVTLPDLSGFDVLGDERRCAPVRSGTECVETLTLQASAPGFHTIAPPTLDAVDARTGRPTRYSANTVRVMVEEGAFSAPRIETEALRALAIVMLAIIAVVLAGLWALTAAPRRRRPRAQSVAPPPPSGPPAEDAAVAAWRAALQDLRSDPARSRLLHVRRLLRERIGAGPDETFGDLAQRGAHLEQPSAMEALRLIERAAFVDDALVAPAVADALPALEALPSGGASR